MIALFKAKGGPFREGVGIGASFPWVGPEAGLGGTGRLR